VSGTAQAIDPRPPATNRWPMRWIAEHPIVPLLGLLAGLVLLLAIVQPGIIQAAWVASTIRFATPLAILAASQTLVMLTGGIDLSVAAVATMAAYIAATQSSRQGDTLAIVLGLGAAAVVGLVNGVGIGIFRVQPLIMTLGMGLVTAGFLTVYQTSAVATAASIPDPIAWLGAGTSFGFLPNALFLVVPLSGIVLFGLRRTGFGRLLYAIGDNETASRLSGVRVWQVHVAVYVLSGFLAGLAGLMVSALANAATLGLADSYLLPSVAAVVIGGTSIFGGRGSYAGSIVGALILTILVSLLTVLDAPEPIRQIIYGALILFVAAAYTRVTGDA
jgi:ribose transport system permease protein